MRLLLILLVILAATLISLLAMLGHRFQQSPEHRGSQADYQLTDGQPYVPGVTYPYAVVAAGVHSAQEFLTAERDPVVKAHYADLRVTGETRVSARRMYASYRVKNRVCWTRNRIPIPDGEPVLLTDTDMMVRERCGNLLSFRIHIPWGIPEIDKPVTTAMTNADTPPHLTFFVPPAGFVPTVPTPVAGTITTNIPPLPSVPAFGVPGYSVLPWFTTYAPVALAPAAIAAPEPKTVGLFLCGFLLLFVAVHVGRGR